MARLHSSVTTARVQKHLDEVVACRRCPLMHPPPVVGRPVVGKVMLVGQAPGDKEPKLGRPFAWTAGKTLFKWFDMALGWSEDETRNRVYFAAVCRCFPGKNPTGGDRVPNEKEIENCSHWMKREFSLLAPQLVLPVGKLAISRFMPVGPLAETVGNVYPVTFHGHAVDVIPLPHPSGASTWHRTEPGISLLRRALQLVSDHPALR